MNKYSDIINIKGYEPKNHKRMSIHLRASQFAPFAALTQYNDDLEEKDRYTSDKVSYTDEIINKINYDLYYLESIIKSNPEVYIKYFEKDSKKDGGRYIEYKGNLRRIDNVYKYIEFNDKKKIYINNIIDINY